MTLPSPHRHHRLDPISLLTYLKKSLCWYALWSILFTKRTALTWLRRHPYSFVTLGDSASVTQYFKALCSVAQFAPKIAVECDTISTLYAFLESGQAIAFMPSHSARLNPDKLHSVRIRSPHCSRTIRLCWPAGRELTPPEMLFYSFCKDYFSAFHSHPESP